MLTLNYLNIVDQQNDNLKFISHLRKNILIFIVVLK